MPATTPEQIHRLFEAAFNAGDLDGLMELYEPDAALIAQRDTNQALYIPRDTVKSHTRAIYRKLGVDSRRMQSQPAANSA